VNPFGFSQFCWVPYFGTLAANRQEKEMDGTVAKYFEDRNPAFGFITPSDGGKDVYVHVDEVERAGLITLRAGDKVSFEIATSHAIGKQRAIRLQKL
jgi:CspA family cold shock protein